MVEKGEATLRYCPSEEQLADLFTKELAKEAFCRLRRAIGVIFPTK